MSKSESKYLNTAIRMDEAFIALLDQKDFDFITVKEICEKAGVNRSTFYLHYETVEDLLQESIGYINNKCFQRFKFKDMAIKISSCPIEDLIFLTPEFIIPYLEFVKENKTIFKTSVEKADTLKADKTFENMCNNIISPILMRFNYKKDEIRYITSFYINGLIAVVMEWIKNNCRDDIQKIMDIIIKVIIPGDSSVMSVDSVASYIDGKIKVSNGCEPPNGRPCGL